MLFIWCFLNIAILAVIGRAAMQVDHGGAEGVGWEQLWEVQQSPVQQPVLWKQSGHTTVQTGNQLAEEQLHRKVQAGLMEHKLNMSAMFICPISYQEIFMMAICRFLMPAKAVESLTLNSFIIQSICSMLTMLWAGQVHVRTVDIQSWFPTWIKGLLLFIKGCSTGCDQKYFSLMKIHFDTF